MSKRRVTTPDDLNYRACLAIATLMSGKEWNADTLDAIAKIIRDAGYVILEPK